MTWARNLGASIGVFGVLVFFALAVTLSGICLHYDLHYWLTFAKHQEVNPSWPLCILIGLIPGIGQLSIPGAIITWVCSLFM